MFKNKKVKEAIPYLVHKDANKGQLDDKFNEQNEKESNNWIKASKTQNTNYEPTNISSAYNSIYWQWKRAKEYYKGIDENIDWNRRYKEAKTIMNS